ncbi:bifunctional protein FolD protein [Spirochaetota bacterium]|nr:bifunctional protein FolD protein [Spirochaetota bacterium]
MNVSTLVKEGTKIIDGKQHSADILAEIKQKTRILTEKTGLKPGLATILVGNDPASHLYVTIKRKKARELGFQDFHQSLPATISEKDLINHINDFNLNDRVHGILVQMPLPDPIDTENVISSLNPRKDVDGFHALNIGSLFRAYTENVIAPCTPAGIMEILRREAIDPAGKHVVIIGRSNLVSKPLAAMLLQNNNHHQLGGNAAVTVIHSGVTNIHHFTSQADILIAAVGKPHFITAPMVKSASIIIDVGINKLKNGTIVGDVDFMNVLPKVRKITPVPGGVGPMTIAALMQNTFKIFKNNYNF